MQKAAAHFFNQRLAICFLTWRAASEEALLSAAKVDHAIGHWLHGTVAKVFNAWKEWAHFKAYSKPIITGRAVLRKPCPVQVSVGLCFEASMEKDDAGALPCSAHSISYTDGACKATAETEVAGNSTRRVL